MQLIENGFESEVATLFSSVFSVRQISMLDH